MFVDCLVLYICCFGNLWFLLFPVGLGFSVDLDGMLLFAFYCCAGCLVGLACLVVRLI